MHSVQKITSSKSPMSFDGLTLLYVRFLRVIGLLPFEARDFSFPASRILATYFLMSTFVECSMFIGYGINHMMSQGELKLDYFSETIPVIGSVIKYVILMLSRRELQELFADSRDIWNNCTESEKRVVQIYEKKIRLFFKFFLSANTVLIIVYSYSALTSRLPPLQPNGPERRILMFRSYVDYISTSPTYELVFALQVFLSCNFMGVLVSGDTVVPLLILLSCGYLRIVQERFALVYEQDDMPEGFTSDMYDELVVCSKLHQSILNMCMKLKNLTPMIFFVQLLCTGYILSLIGIKFADRDKYKFVWMFFIFVMQLYICQWAPDLLIQESEAVSTAAYFTSLSRTSSLRTRKLLSIVIRRSQRPVILTAGGFIRLSIETFGRMISRSVSFFAALRSFIN